MRVAGAAAVVVGTMGGVHGVGAFGEIWGGGGGREYEEGGSDGL